MEKERVSWEGHYIGEPTLFKAVAFANQMISEGKSMSEALGISSNYHKVAISAVALEFMTDRFIKNSDRSI